MGKFKVGDRVEWTRAAGFEDAVVTAYDALGGWPYTIAQGVRHTYASESELRPVAANAQPAPLTIQAGKFYRTRDGRKVGPMEDYGENEFWPHKSGSLEERNFWNPDGKAYWGNKIESDLIAEWVDEPSATWTTTGFTIPVDDGWYATELGRAYSDGYAAGLKAGSDGGKDDVEFDLAVLNSVARLKRRGLLAA